MFSSSVNQYLQQQQQHQSAQGGSAIVSQPPSYTTVISKSNPKPTIKNLITSRGKHQTANVVYTSNKSMNNIYNAYSCPQQQSQQNLSGQSIERICKYCLTLILVCFIIKCFSKSSPFVYSFKTQYETFNESLKNEYDELGAIQGNRSNYNESTSVMYRGTSIVIFSKPVPQGHRF